MEVSRREFLKYLGITGIGITLGGCDSMWSVPDEIYEKVGGMPGIETWKTSVCSLCPAGCGIKVRLIDGIPVRIHGNPIHPVNRGGICPMAEAGVESLFNPDRLKGPLQRISKRGEGKWESISWDDALQVVVTRLQSLREKNSAHKLAFWAGSENNLSAPLFARFMQAFGSPNLFHFDQAQASNLATYITQGHKNALGYDFKNVKLLINFGADLLDSGPSPVRFNQIYSEMRNRENGQSANIVHVGSRLSRTAGNSSAWVPIKPGTMAALALGMANVLIKDRQYNRGFVQTSSFGFDSWRDKNGTTHKGFKTLVSQEYYPEKVAEITGVPAAKIVELAREFGAEESALVLAGGEAANSSNGLYTLWAIECLNALKGNFDGKGPISVQKEPPFAALAQVRQDRSAMSGFEQPQLSQGENACCFFEYATARLPGGILNKKPYEIDTLLLANVNPVFTSVNQADYIAALKEIPFIVSFAPFVDETNVYADLILPDHTFLEKQEVFYKAPTVEFRYFGLQQPVIEPIHDTRHTGDFILQLSKRLSDTTSSQLPWQNYSEYLRARIEGIYTTGAGTIFTEKMDKAWLKFLKERGWQIFDYTSFEEFWEVLADKGGWLDPFPEETNFNTVFATPSKKFEFYSQVLEKEFNSQLAAQQSSGAGIDSLLLKWQISASGDAVFLPHFEPLRYEPNAGKFNLHLSTGDLITNIRGAGSNLPLVQELFGLLAREYWNSWVEINPETAHSNGISDGDIVRISSKEGSLNVKAKIHPGIMPDVVHVPFGLGHTAYGEYAMGIGVNPYKILEEDYDFLSGAPSLISTKVRIEKANGKEHV